jgi:hypothetical protein
MCVAWRILFMSISSTLASPTPTAMALNMMWEKSSSRRSAGSCLESLRPLGIFARLRMTAAATTGPASGPRPASSTPATRPSVRFNTRASKM